MVQMKLACELGRRTCKASRFRGLDRGGFGIRALLTVLA
jgi:hypothetical protein